MKTIDPIKPIPRKPAAVADPIPHPRARSIDGVQRTPSKWLAVARPTPAGDKGSGARFTKLNSSPKRRRKKAWGLIAAILASPLLIVLGMAGMLGVVALGIYGVVAILLRLPSRITFTLALAALVFITALQLASEEDLAESVAVLAYILLAIGVVSLAIEARRDAKLWFKKH